ncbi:MAG: ribonuclease HI [Bacteroidota bacterium]|nr:ribonuclease HI [Bacteroidota bacterium]
MKRVIIYTDGACSGNPGPGGYAAILRYGGHERVITGGFSDTTNNRMELYAAIKALEALREPCAVTLFTDSRYLADAVNRGWAMRWKAAGWKRNKKEPALNADLWDRLLRLLERHRVRIVWTAGHAGDEGNERCDRLAVEALQTPGLPPDIRGEPMSAVSRGE